MLFYLYYFSEEWSAIIQIPRVACINDLSGFGRCSLTAAIPVISALGVMACPLPTAILSNQTGFPDYFMDDYTDKLKIITDKWQKQKMHFDGIFAGFLGNEEQADIIMNFIKTFKNSDTIVVIDPVMGDNGKIYDTYSVSKCKKVASLVACADIVTPNLTEACILTGDSFDDVISADSLEPIYDIAKKICSMGPDTVIITGIPTVDNGEQYIANVAVEKNKFYMAKTRKIGKNGYSGTGDVLSSVICGCAVSGVDTQKALNLAAEFIEKSISDSNSANTDPNEGICFEPNLNILTSFMKGYEF